MHRPSALQRWLAGWADLARHRDVSGYRERSRLARLRLDLLCIVAACRRGSTWRAVLWSLALGLAAQILCWRHDLRGPVREILQCLPVLLVAPWVAAGRRRFLEARASETAFTEPAADRRESAAVGDLGHATWNDGRTRARHVTGRAAAGSISSSPSSASARSRRWRSRASRN
ncbi:MAG: hypothetical protein IT486_01400 [Gammaproteobacteria bacterium]|nr:hypothetical protein [Gammaproteobacteria bacterium]